MTMIFIYIFLYLAAIFSNIRKYLQFQKLNWFLEHFQYFFHITKSFICGVYCKNIPSIWSGMVFCHNIWNFCPHCIINILVVEKRRSCGGHPPSWLWLLCCLQKFRQLDVSMKLNRMYDIYDTTLQSIITL